MSKKSILNNLTITFAFVLLSPLSAFAASFSDVPQTNVHYNAIEFLKTEGIINGYADGTFKPDQIVNRAEALKMVFSARSTPLKDYTIASFKDVLTTDWFFKYVETAKELKIVGGNPDGTFAPARTVNKAEFLKMLELGFDVKFVNYKNPVKPLYADMTDQTQWFVPYFDFAKNLNLIIPDAKGNIYPSQNLTRGDVAEILYKFELIMKGGSTQLLLSRTEAQLMQLMLDLQSSKIADAKTDIANAKSLVKQALEKSPNEAIVKAASKVVDAFDALVNAYDNSTNKQYAKALEFCSSAYKLSDESMALSKSVENLSNQVKAASKALADSVRAEQAK